MLIRVFRSNFRLVRGFSQTFSNKAGPSSIYSLQGLDHKTEGDQLLTFAKSLVQEYWTLKREDQEEFFVKLATNYGANKAALEHAITLFQKNPSYFVEVRNTATPLYYKLLKMVANLPGGVKTVCDMRAHILDFIAHQTDREKVHSLRRIEEACRELLTIWFCLSNLRLERVTWESPGDILYKIAENEAVHPIRGIVDFRKRIGAHRRCFYFGHQAMPREPLVMVHVALMDKIADNVQTIVKSEDDTFDENLHTTAIYYSITSIQKGLSGIDLGNMLIKQVATKITSELPNIKIHSTLSPIPGFRAWLLRCLHEHSEYGQIVDDFIIRTVRRATGKQNLSKDEVTDLLIKIFSAERISLEQLDLLR
ncbi:hypothetical protein WR25_19158 isoform A [Diploscapter pachys]|uniref:Malonyl-CoA decarboxylase C-terminal domain-containing protein n=1 Tax=Diploscapter pachys TaxID=2018661 RepID=A0A2A2KHC0_9BILA|nr:hypothetical protein WR25_19158 isoform A [Diploscapter pachys]